MVKVNLPRPILLLFSGLVLIDAYPAILGALLYIGLFVTLGLVRGTNNIVLFLSLEAVGIFVAALLAYVSTFSWLSVLASARLLGLEKGKLNVAKVHIASVQRHLNRSLEGLEQDLLAVSLRNELPQESADSKGNPIARMSQALLIDFARILFSLPSEGRRATLKAYNTELENCLRDSPTPAAAVLSFLTKRFLAMNESLRWRARTWIPPKTLAERIESHRVGVQALVTVSGFIVVILVAVLLHFYAGFP